MIVNDDHNKDWLSIEKIIINEKKWLKYLTYLLIVSAA